MVSVPESLKQILPCHIRETGCYLVYCLIAGYFLLLPLIELTFGNLVAKDK